MSGPQRHRRPRRSEQTCSAVVGPLGLGNGDILGFQGLPGLGVNFVEGVGSPEGKKKVSETIFSGQELGRSAYVWTYCHSSKIPSLLAQSVM